jgi:hypothetical protein
MDWYMAVHRVDGVKPMVESLVTEGAITADWKQESTGHTDKFVVFAPWKDVAQYPSCLEQNGYETIATHKGFIVRE